MKILFVNPTKKLRVGMINLIRGLSDKTEKIFILTPKKVDNPLSENKNVKLLVYPSIFLPKIRYTIPYFFKQKRMINAIIKKEKIDLIHCWSYFYPVNIAPLIVAKRNKIPIISTVDTFPGINWNYGGSKIVDLSSMLYTKTIGSYVLKKMDKVVLMGKYLENPAKKLGIKDYGIIPLSLDVKRFQVKPSEKLKKDLFIGKKDKVLITIGRLVPVKGIDKIIKISKNLLDEGNNIKTLIVGDGPYEKEYKKMARGYPQIKFLGRRKDIPELLAISDVFILASVSEGFPNVLLEAMASGISIVTTDVGGAREILSNYAKKKIFTNQFDILNSVIESIKKPKNQQGKIKKEIQDNGKAARKYLNIYNGKKN